MRFANFRGSSPELVPEPPFACKYYTKPLKEGVPELIPDSFLESLQTSLSLVWFAAATPEEINSKLSEISKKPLTRVSQRVFGSTERGGWRGVGRKGWRRVGRHRVGEGLADFVAPSNFGIPEAPV